jgi:hypothetical protein
MAERDPFLTSGTPPSKVQASAPFLELEGTRAEGRLGWVPGRTVLVPPCFRTDAIPYAYAEGEATPLGFGMSLR